MFYRVAGEPFHRMNIQDFIQEIDELTFQCEHDYETKFPGKKFNLEQVPYVVFLEYYKKRPYWENLITNLDSPFMKLL